ncbi:MAG: heavy metal-responsive transcriptional regulator [Actinobacteria bacterium]|nr:heavy metal-responsive transcriptional regulator [Actinomycetota bacterium]
MLIGELAEATGVTAKTLRYYEQQGLLPAPDRTAGGYRDYDPAIVQRVAFIRQAQAAGLTLRQIGEVLAVRDDGRAPCQHVAEVVDERLGDVEARLRKLRRTRDQLRRLRSRLDELDPADCPPGEICRAVTRP